MDDSLPLRFFQEPSCPRQRQYEALRAVFVEGLSQKEAARRFGYSYLAFRQLVHEFRQSFHPDEAGGGNGSPCGDEPPPFSSGRTQADPWPTRAGADLANRRRQPSQMHGS